MGKKKSLLLVTALTLGLVGFGQADKADAVTITFKSSQYNVVGNGSLLPFDFNLDAGVGSVNYNIDLGTSAFKFSDGTPAPPSIAGSCLNACSFSAPIQVVMDTAVWGEGTNKIIKLRYSDAVTPETFEFIDITVDNDGNF